MSVPVWAILGWREAIAGSGEMCICWAVLRKLNQFAVNGLRMFTIVQYPWPASAALHALFVHVLFAKEPAIGQEDAEHPCAAFVTFLTECQSTRSFYSAAAIEC